MSDAPWQILVVDDDPIICRQIKQGLDNETLGNKYALRVITTQKFNEALSILETSKIDIVILDVRHDEDDGGEESGIKTLNDIKATRFVPVIFYTGNQTLVNSLESKVIRIVEKTQKIPGIEAALLEILDDGIPAANRAILRHVEHAQRDFMWKLPEILARYKQSADKLSIAFLMARRLASSLEEDRVDHLAKEMGHTGDLLMDGETVHPMFFYIIPPIDGAIRTGGIYRDPNVVHWVVMTNACDLELREDKKTKVLARNAEHILLARCRIFAEEPEYAAWKAKPNDKDTVERFHKLIKNNRGGGQPERFFFLPAGLDFPDLVVDVQNTKVVSADDLSQSACLANIDSPYLESLIARFTRYYARIGTPDINIDAVIRRFK